MHDLTRDERRLCVKLAYALMLLASRNRDAFDALARAIFDRVPEVSGRDGNRLLRDLLVVAGGRYGEPRASE